MEDNITILLKLLNENIIDSILYNSEDIQDFINHLNTELKKSDYIKIVNLILYKLNLTNSSNLATIFSNKPKFKISTYKNILRIKASKIFDELKSQKGSLFVSFSRELCDSLVNHDVKDILIMYKKELKYIDTVCNVNDFIHLIKKHKSALLSCDNIEINNTKTEIREYSRHFNILYKEYFIKKYIEKELEKIKKDFIIKGDYNSNDLNLISESAFLKLFLDDKKLSNNFKSKVLDYFNVEIENNLIEKIIHNILNDNDKKNYEILKIDYMMNDINQKIEILKQNKAFHRLVRNYRKNFNDIFRNFDKDLLMTIFDDINNINNYRQYLTKLEFSFLIEIIDIYNKANCKMNIVDNNIIFCQKNDIDDIEIADIKKAILNYKKYLGIKKLIMKYYVNLSKSKNNILDIFSDNFSNIDTNNLIFDDDNYQIKNENTLLNIKLLFGIIKNIKPHIIDNYDTKVIDYIKRILFDEGLLGCVMKYNSDIDISNIINCIKKIEKFDKVKNIKNIDLEYLIKQTNLYNIADEFSISVLGLENANKIINNRQFIQNNNFQNIEQRLNKAVDLSIRSVSKNKSSIPYDITTKFKNIIISRYDNDDPDLLVSGIDTNTCFKIDGNDNDFVFYTVLNKNGAVLKITDDKNNFIGRISIFRQANVLFINGIRTKEEKEKNITKEIVDKNKNIFQCLIELSNNLIEMTSNSDLPIDFVVCNKAGILESSYFKEDYYIVPEYIINQPIDIYNDDWQDFIHTYDNYNQNYLTQANDKTSFTTDFGHYTPILIASRDNRLLQSKFDIAYDSPDAIYERPLRKDVANNNFNSILNKVYRIDAIQFLYDLKNLDESKKRYQRKTFNDIEQISVCDYSYQIKFKNGDTCYNCINISDDDKVKKKIKY